MELFLNPGIWVSLLTLTALEIVLGVDNLVFISIATQRLLPDKRPLAHRVGLILACISRLVLLATIVELTHFTQPLFSIAGQSFSMRDLVLIGGGLFLLAKSTSEIHMAVFAKNKLGKIRAKSKFSLVVIQIMILDVLFSLDSVMSAVGLAQEFIIMALAIIIAMFFMLLVSDYTSQFIHKYPTLKMLALNYLLLIGMALIADGFGFHVPRGYLYFAMAFSGFVELMNILSVKKRKTLR